MKIKGNVADGMNRKMPYRHFDTYDYYCYLIYYEYSNTKPDYTNQNIKEKKYM